MKFNYWVVGLSLGLAAITPYTLAAIYQEKNNDGIVFTDHPTNSNAELLITTPTSVVETVSAQPNSSTNKAEPAPAIKNVPYTAFNLISPTNGQTLQNQPQLSASFDIQPTLQPGDTIQLYLDGQPWGAPQASPQITMTIPSRGTHTFAAKLMDAKQTVLQQVGPITIYVHQQSALNPNNPANKPQVPYGINVNGRNVNTNAR